MWRLAGIGSGKGLDRVFHRAGAEARFLTARDFAGLKPSASTVVRLALLVVRVNAGETPALL